MRCPNCNRKIPDGSGVCSFCGADLKENESYSGFYTKKLDVKEVRYSRWTNSLVVLILLLLILNVDSIFTDLFFTSLFFGLLLVSVIFFKMRGSRKSYGVMGFLMILMATIGLTEFLIRGAPLPKIMVMILMDMLGLVFLHESKST